MKETEKKWRIGAAFCDDYLRSLLNNGLSSKNIELTFFSSPEEAKNIQDDSIDLLVVPSYIDNSNDQAVQFVRQLRAQNFSGIILIETVFRRVTREIIYLIEIDKNKKTFWAFSLEIPYTIKKLFSEAA